MVHYSRSAGTAINHAICFNFYQRGPSVNNLLRLNTMASAMVANKKLRAKVDELRDELSSLRKERADPVTPSSTDKPVNKSKTAKPSEPDEQDGETGDLEQMLKDMAEVGEKEIAEHPTLAVGVAFILGVLVGRLTKA